MYPAPYDFLLAKTRHGVIHHIRENPKQRSMAIHAEPEWFDQSHAQDKKLAGYPFNLGIWAKELAMDIQEAQQKGHLRLDLIFAYVVHDSYYRGIIKFDTPLDIQISVRVTEQRHLKIKPNSVVLASIHDDTEFTTWRPQVSDDGQMLWRQQKTLQTMSFAQVEDYCPVYISDVHVAMKNLLGVHYLRVDEAATEEEKNCMSLELAAACKDFKRIHMTKLYAIVNAKMIRTPIELMQHYAKTAEMFKVISKAFSMGSSVATFHSRTISVVKQFYDQLTQEYDKLRTQFKEENNVNS